jgi:hypothetical protein
VPDRIASDLLLIARSPTTGRLRHRSSLEIGLRAALFADLAFQQRLVQSRSGPAVLTTGEDPPSEDRVLDKVLTAVHEQPGVSWKRWYHHVGVDRAVLTKELVEQGRWVRERDRLGRVVHRDTDQDATLALVQAALQVAEFQAQPRDGRQAVLAVLTTMCGSVVGRPKPRALRQELKPLLDTAGISADPIRIAVEGALGGCGVAIRKRSRILA